MLNRRNFLTGTAWMGVLAASAQVESVLPKKGGIMQGYAAPALKKVRVGCVGLGARGSGGVHRLAQIPGVEVCALCEVRPEALAASQ